MGSATPDASTSPTGTPAPEPTGLSAGWETQTERTVDGSDGDLVVRTGDINNLGYGWPAHFTPFSGKETPAHAWPCQLRPGVAQGTDRIMLGTGVTASSPQGRSDGYAGCTSRPNNLPAPVVLAIGALPDHIRDVYFQIFVDDFQAPVWGSRFQVSLDGTRIPAFENTINMMDQTGPIGKLVTLRLLPEYWPLLKNGSVSLLIDDPTTQKRDGYALDFVRILVNPHFRYVVTVNCTVADAATLKPIAGASVSTAGANATTDRAGTCSMRGIPAGIVTVDATALDYDAQTQLLDLSAGTHGTAHFLLKRHREKRSDIARSLQRTGTATIYGIHFDTASAHLRPDSVPSLEAILQVVSGDRATHWTITGHTDDQGGAAYNLGLSLARAKSVIAWLAVHGVGADRFTAQGYGLTRPIADNATNSGRALNRRVEVSVRR